MVENQEVSDDLQLSFEDMIAICIGWFGLSLLEAKRCTMKDFRIYLKAREIKKQSDREAMSFQAWQNRVIKSDKKIGKSYKPYFDKFSDFYDTRKEFAHIFNPPKTKKKEEMTMLERLNMAIQKGG